MACSHFWGQRDSSVNFVEEWYDGPGKGFSSSGYDDAWTANTLELQGHPEIENFSQ
jgi:hypothetical protein